MRVPGDGDECLARLMESAADEPIGEQVPTAVYVATGGILERARAAAPLTSEQRAVFFAEVDSVTVGFPEEAERMRRLLDELDRALE